MSSTVDKWDVFKAEFYRDGSLRDIYAFATGPEDWRRLADYVAANYPFRFNGAWSIAAFTTDQWVTIQHVRRHYPFNAHATKGVVSGGG